MTKIAFFGTPEFAGKILSGILKFSEVETVLVVSQPDKVVGRKRVLQATPVKQIALDAGIEVLQPERLKVSTKLPLSGIPPQGTLSGVSDSIHLVSPLEEKEAAGDFHEILKNLNLDFIVVVAYGRIIPKAILDIPKYGCINLHGSILPQYRGASPVQASVKAGDSETGLTTMYMSEGMDEGDILKIQKVEIEADDSSQDIFRKFSEIGPKLLLEALQGITSGELVGVSQDEKLATYCGKISREDGEVFFQKQSVSEIYNIFRAYTPWPGIYTWYEGKRLVLEEVAPFSFKGQGELRSKRECPGVERIQDRGSHEQQELPAGSFLKLSKNHYGIVCSDGQILEILRVKLEGKKSMDVMSFVNGNREILGYIVK